MSGFVAVEMYLALADELKAYREKTKFLETEVQGLRKKCQVLEIDLVEREEQIASTKNNKEVMLEDGLEDVENLVTKQLEKHNTK